jgi:hypothetical protein
MAVPTITAIDPMSGLASGRNVVEITGTNFRLPPSPPALGYVGGEEQITVSVQFQGIPVAFCAAASDTLIVAHAPAWSGPYTTMPLALDVRVANLDDAGAEIVGENATLAGGYTIRRPSLAATSFLQKHVDAVIKYFRRLILENTHVTTSRDFVSDPAANKRARARAPVIYLAGPRLPRNTVETVMYMPEEDHVTDPNGWVRRAEPIVTDIEFDLFLITVGQSAERQILALQQALMTTLRDVPELTVDADHRYHIWMPFDSYPIDTSSANMSDLHIVQAVCTIKGVHLDHEAAIIVERGWSLYDNDGMPLLDMQAHIGT